MVIKAAAAGQTAAAMEAGQTAVAVTVAGEMAGIKWEANN